MTWLIWCKLCRTEAAIPELRIESNVLDEKGLTFESECCVMSPGLLGQVLYMSIF